MDSGDATKFGHSAGEINVRDSEGDIVSLQEALDGKSSSFELSGPGCVEKDLEELCGDGDGCTVRIQAKSNGKVYTVDEHLYMEENSGSVIGYTRQEGGGTTGYGYLGTHWQSGSNTKNSLFSPFDLVILDNYKRDDCPGQSGDGAAYSDPYTFNFFVAPQVEESKIIIYDR
mgnify:CR=1 FL=1